MPADFRGFARISTQLEPRVLATVVAPPDSQGRLSLSLHAGATVDALHTAAADPNRLVIAEINHQLPHTIGLPPDHPHCLHVDEVDVLYEVDRPPFILDEADPTPIEIAIAGHVAPYIKNGSTLQTGIGGVPNAVMKQLAAGDGGDFGVHSEMFTTGLMKLHQAGKVSNRKGVYDGFSPATFAAGTRELYDWLDGNDEVRFLPVECINDPSIIARNRNFVSINGTLSVDLQGQLVADSIAGRQFSGIGGHEDFVAGAVSAVGGHSLICLPSTAGRGDTRVSRIVAEHPRGSLITTPRHLTDVVITEYGAAELPAKTVRERAEALAAIAHPAVRDALLAGETELPPIPADAD
jgi:acyl-CoA hydrolase